MTQSHFMPPPSLALRTPHPAPSTPTLSSTAQALAPFISSPRFPQPDFNSINTVNEQSQLRSPITGKRVYPCRVCGFHLTSSSNRTRHERTKHLTPQRRQRPQKHPKPATGLAAAAAQSQTGHKRSAASAFSPASPAPAIDEIVQAAGFSFASHYGASSRAATLVMTPRRVAESEPELPLLPVTSNNDQQPGEDMEIDVSTASDSPDEHDTSEEAPAAAAAATSAPTELEGAHIRADDEEGKEEEQKEEEEEEGAQVAAAGEIPAPLDLPAYEPAPSLQDTQLQAACLPFLQWMCQPPITQVEALIKARRVKVITQLQPIKLNLRFIFGLLLESEAITDLELQALTRLAVCQALGGALEKRQVGSGRIHAIFLLVKKVLVYLSSCKSTQRRQFISPATQESYMYVESICSDSSHRRKQEARNRSMLGVQTSKLLHQAQPARGLPALTVDAFNMPSMQGNIEVTAKASVGPAAVSNAPRQLTLGAAASAAHLAASINEPSSNELTGEELTAVARGSLAYLQSREHSYYVHHLVTATLSLGLAPRSQVMKQLQLGSSFVKEADGRYWIKMAADMNKNGKPTCFALPLQLTEPFDYYLESIRPNLLRQGDQQHNYVFVKKNGTAPRSDFSELTSIATQQLIHRPVNAHAFRSAVITAFYETGATQSDMDVLANIMAHDSATARSYYFRPHMAKAVVSTNDRLLRVLNAIPAAATSDPAAAANAPVRAQGD